MLKYKRLIILNNIYIYIIIDKYNIYYIFKNIKKKINKSKMYFYLKILNI